ncbi:MAG: pyridoxamine 5'-phosphate oxidase family protein [Myxococcota bacterium]|nr:pyridoxamine 5'-phosphate oxidase [Deltaproteobacteria bacterium]MCP4241415.1 pyridoxamine 5'-phosphate oxidase family protein [bacterium]MDP6244541.1 pyridoxamine 5'-phosphate oxidase family protein [Myxococcota bacterium]MDP7074348.1 pyridoxamine 5'-phosphate oxidase family protein [Myxococcota bacterium]MDP7300504.1 pyridoxamine 5'-phosphate oxidase family protein [Myxococcota bacterium]
MAQRYSELIDAHIRFIEAQKIFFTGSAASEGRVNVSPKGHDSLSVLSPNQLVWLNFTGSGNETAAHLLDCNRMTLMWCAFERKPQILRVYGSAEAVHPRDERWEEFAEIIPASLGARQYFLVNIDLVQTSCGYAVPLFEYQEDRDVLTRWTDKRGPDGIREYWEQENATSLDGAPTGIVALEAPTHVRSSRNRQ